MLELSLLTVTYVLDVFYTKPFSQDNCPGICCLSILDFSYFLFLGVGCLAVIVKMKTVEYCLHLENEW